MKQKIDVNALRPGMYVEELDRPWLETPFLFQGFPIRSYDEIRQLQRCCHHVYIDVDKTRDWRDRRHPPADQSHEHLFDTRQVNVKPSAAGDTTRDHYAFLRDIKPARELYVHTHEYVTKLLDDVRLGHSVDPETTRRFVDRIADTIVRNDSTLMWLTQLKHRDEYTSYHSLNVCVIALVFGNHLGLGAQELRELGIGALLHDIGKMRIPLQVLQKTGKLDDNEWAMMKRHPFHGYEALAHKPGIPPRALEIVRSHHERIDGSGYPRGLSGSEIDRFTVVTSIADVYDAITSDRVYHPGISPHEALYQMYDWAVRHFPKDLVEEFIKCLGIFPIGSIVELDTGEVGVVMTVNRRDHLNPIVTLALDPDKKPYPVRKLINLEHHNRTGRRIHVRRILESHAYNIDVREILNEGESNLVVGE